MNDNSRNRPETSAIPTERSKATRDLDAAPVLEPCPLEHPIECGVVITDYREDFNNPRYMRFWIECVDCGLELEGPVTSSDVTPLIEKWNTRYKPSPESASAAIAHQIERNEIIAQRDALKDALTDLVHQLPTDERLADFNLDRVELALSLVPKGDADEQ